MKRHLCAGEGYVPAWPLHYNHMRGIWTTKTLRVVFTILIMLSTVALAQSQSPKMDIGEKIPKNLDLGRFVQNDLRELNTRDLIGKATILEYWATWCGACIAMFPTLDSLQKAHQRYLNIYLINVDRKTIQERNVLKMLPRLYERFPELELPMIYGHNTTVLSDFMVLPHYLWFDAHGRLRAITGSEAINSNNIVRLIAGLSIHGKIKDR